MKHRTGTALLFLLLLTSLLASNAIAAEETLSWDETYRFTAESLQAEDCAGVLLTQVPGSTLGALMLGDRQLKAGDALLADQLNQVVFIPAEDASGAASVSCLRLSDQGTSPYSMTLKLIHRRNEPPTAEDSEFKTYKNIPGQVPLTVSDPENGALTVTILTEPKRGTVEVDAGGAVTYTPTENQVGKDSFTYTVTDPEGAVSQEATVRVIIQKPSHAQTYGDMEGDPAQLAAQWLMEEDIFTGESVAGSLLFHPDAQVTRGEFLAMCAGFVGTNEAVVSTGFSDEAATPAWLGPYVTTALRCGFLSGVPGAGGLRLDPDAVLTQAQAAKMVSAILCLGQDGAETVMAKAEAIPTWARDSAAALSALDLYTVTDGEAPMTRREAALLLYRAGCYAEAHQKDTGLLAWAAR